MSRRLIGGDVSDRSSSLSKGLSGVLQVIEGKKGKKKNMLHVKKKGGEIKKETEEKDRDRFK